MLMDDEGSARNTVIFQDSFESDDGWSFTLSPGQDIGVNTGLGRGYGRISDGTLYLAADQDSASSSYANASKSFDTLRAVDNLTWKIDVESVESRTDGNWYLELKYNGLMIRVDGTYGSTSLSDPFTCLYPGCEQKPFTLFVTYRNGVVTASVNNTPSIELESWRITELDDGLSEVKILTYAQGEDGGHYTFVEISEVKLSSF
jgi:hypothetical protein